MLGRFLFVLSISLLFLVGVIDRFGGRFDNQWISRTATLLDDSFWADLTIYGGCVTFITVSLSLFVPESGNELLIESFTTVDPFMYSIVWMMMTAWVFTWAFRRYMHPMHAAYATHNRNMDLEESVDGVPSPSEGIDHVVSYIEAHKKEWPAGAVESFLDHLAMRKDETGAEARRRLEEIREKKEPT